MLKSRAFIALASWLVLSASALASGPAAAPGPERAWLALLPFETPQAEVAADAVLMQARLRALLTQGDVFYVVPELWPEVAFEQQQQPALRCGDKPSCYQDLGNRMGLDWLLTGTLTRHDKTLRIQVQLIDLRQGSVAKEELHECTCPMSSVLNRIATNFSQDFRALALTARQPLPMRGE